MSEKVDAKAEKLFGQAWARGLGSKRTTYRRLVALIEEWRYSAEQVRALLDSEEEQGNKERVQYWLGSAQCWEECANELEKVITPEPMVNLAQTGKDEGKQ